MGTRIALPVSLPSNSGSALDDGLRGAGLGDDHVEASGAAATVALVEVVDEVLVVGERVRGLDVPVDHTVAVIDHLEHGRDAVGGAGGGR